MIQKSPSTHSNTTPPHQIPKLEAYEQLLARARSKIFDPLPPERIVNHVLAIVEPQSGWPVQREALEALIRRMAFARRDGLRVASKPPGGHSFGLYAVRRPREKPRPYRTLLRGVDPIDGSCDCPDFLRNSLGLCKHLLVVLCSLAAQPRVWDRALRTAPLPPTPRRGGVIWNPVRPLEGNAPWLERVEWQDGASTRGTPRIKSWLGARSKGNRVRAPLELVKELRATLRAQRGDSIPDPALVRLVELELERARALGRPRMSKRTLRSSLRKLRVRLYDYQEESVARFLDTGRLLLADDMGLGKTAQAIACATLLHEHRRIRKGLIVCPAPLKVQWRNEWQRFSNMDAKVVEGTPTDRSAVYQRTKRGFLIINYEQLLRDLGVIEDWGADLVVLDEAQRIKNWATKTALAVKRLEPPYRLVLTGTPLENRLDELASIVEWVDDFALEPKWRLNPWHTITADGKAEVIGVRGLDTLRARLAPHMIRRVRQDVLEQLPSRTDTVVPLSMSAEQIEVHEELSPAIVRLLQVSKKRPLTRQEFMRLMTLLATQRVVSNGLAQQDFREVWPTIRSRRPTERRLRQLSSPKLLEVRALFQSLLEQDGRKVVVFSQWRRALQLAHWAIHDLLEDRGERAVFFTGSESQKRRTHNIVDFHDDPATRVFFATDAGGTGLNLQRAASCVVNFELPWNPAVLEQRIGRVYRLGQEHPIDVYNFVTTDSIESRIASVVSNKKALFDGLFDGATDHVVFDDSGSFLERLRECYSDDGTSTLPAPSVDDREDSDELESTIVSADESTDTAPEEETWMTDSPSTRALFEGVRIETHEDGSLTLEAQPEAARTLATLFQGMAQLLTRAAKEADGQ